MRKIGILGGTFDPIHTGHLVLGENAWQQLELDEVWYMISGNPPHKRNRQGLATDEQRIDMVKLAIVENPHFKLSLEDMNSGDGYSYTYMTLEQLHEKYPDCEFYFIIGGDSFRDFHTWRHPEIIVQYAKIVACVRDEITDEAFSETLQKNTEMYGDVFIPLKTPVMQISSHIIRQMVSEGKSVRYQIPDPVISYIEKHHIYGEPEAE